MSGLDSDKDGGLPRCDKADLVMNKGEVVGELLGHRLADAIQLLQGHSLIKGVIDPGNLPAVFVVSNHSVEAKIGAVRCRWIQPLLHVANRFFRDRSKKAQGCHEKSGG